MKRKNLPSIRRAAIYCRISNQDDERTGSLDSQAKSGMTLAKELGFVVDPDDIYYEKFTGAELYDRPILTAIRRDCKAGRYQALICHATDRLARDPIHLAIVAEECQRRDVSLHFVTEPLDTSDEAGLIRYVKGYASKIEREKIRERTVRGKEEVLASGKLICNGWARFGYVYDKEKGVRDSGTRRRLIDPVAAAIVAEIFSLARQGATATSIADMLNKRGVAPPSDRLDHRRVWAETPIWRTGTVIKLLKDETYTGKTFWGVRKNNGKRRKGGRPIQVLQARKEWRVLDDGLTPRIIDDETFAAVQALIADRAARFYRRPTGKTTAMLRGRITCGECGEAMYPTVRTAGGRRYEYYFCRTHSRAEGHSESQALLKGGPKCRNGMTPCPHADAAVWEWICDLHANPDLVRERFEEIQGQTDDSHERDQLSAIQEKIGDLVRQAKKSFDRWKGEDDPDIAAMIDEDIKATKRTLAQYRDEEATCRGRIESLDARQAAARFTEAMLTAAGETIRRDADFETKLKVVEALGITVVARRKAYRVSFQPPMALSAGGSSSSKALASGTKIEFTLTLYAVTA